jgi:hypothetical protein
MIRALSRSLSLEPSMKKLLLAGLTLFSASVFSQSYIILQNGVTLTTDKFGFVYDFNHFSLPYKVSITGGNFLVEDERLETVDENGFLFIKDPKDIKIKKINGKGLNYFITDNNHLVTIDARGFYFRYDKDSGVFRKAAKFGGNYFTVEENSRNKIFDLYTVNTKGNYFKINLAGLNPADIELFGGKYFVTRQGVLHTVSSEGFVFSKPALTMGKIIRQGGNFFVDDTGKLYTVSEEGFVFLPILPANLKIAELERFASNYMIDREGRIFVVDHQGLLFEREVFAHDLRNSRILSR